MNFFGKKITVVTHSGSFHADDVFACATLKIWTEKSGLDLKIVRSRDAEIINRADIVVDVGNIYDAEKNRFDHHQQGGAGTRDNKIPYASFGLVWKHFGKKICSQEIVDRVEKTLVLPIDARDNGIRISSPNELGILEHRTSDMICNFVPTWQESQEEMGDQFNKALNFAEEIIMREIAEAGAKIEGEKLTREAIRNQNDPEVLILEKYLDWEKVVSESKKVRMVVYKNRNGKDWSVQSARDDLENYASDRANMPHEWGGLREEDLVKISGIPGAVFCSNRGWYGSARTREAAIAMAKKALEN